MNIGNIATLVAGILFIVIGGGCFGWFKLLSGTNDLLKEQNTELRAENKEWRTKHSENEKAIANLQGQIDTLKTVPLQQISAGLDAISQTNAKILETLEQSASTLARNTAQVGKAVEQVRSDLKN